LIFSATAGAQAGHDALALALSGRGGIAGLESRLSWVGVCTGETQEGGEADHCRVQARLPEPDIAQIRSKTASTVWSEGLESRAVGFTSTAAQATAAQRLQLLRRAPSIIAPCRQTWKSAASHCLKGNALKASLFYLPTIGSRAEIEAGMAGMRDDLYQRMLRDLSEQIRLADELGYDSVSFTEHHFHIEGFELSNNPCCSISISPCRPGGSASASSASCCRPPTRSGSPRTSRCSTT
jgi:hypothetical protein